MKDRRSFVSFPALMNIEMHNNQLDNFFKKIAIRVENF